MGKNDNILRPHICGLFDNLDCPNKIYIVVVVRDFERKTIFKTHYYVTSKNLKKVGIFRMKEKLMKLNL